MNYVSLGNNQVLYISDDKPCNRSISELEVDVFCAGNFGDPPPQRVLDFFAIQFAEAIVGKSLIEITSESGPIQGHVQYFAKLSVVKPNGEA